MYTTGAQEVVIPIPTPVLTGSGSKGPSLKTSQALGLPLGEPD